MSSLSAELSSSIIPSALNFPFSITFDKHQFASVKLLLDQIRGRIESMPEDESIKIKETIRGDTVIKLWRKSTRIMMGTLANIVQNSEVIEFARLHVETLQAFEALCDDKWPVFEHSVLLKPIRGPVIQISHPVHFSRPCAVCKKMKEGPQNLFELAEFVLDGYQVANDGERTRLGDWKARLGILHEHVLTLIDLFEFTIQTGENSESTRRVCSEYSDKLMKNLHKHFGGQPTISNISRIQLIRIAKSCISNLSVEVRRDFIPLLLFREIIESDHFQVQKLFLDQHDRNFFTSSVIQQLASLTKPQLYHGHIEVRYHESEAVGNGAVRQMVSWAIEDMLKPEFGLFEYSDERQAFLKPRRRRESDLNEYRQFGRLIAYGISLGMSMGIHLTPGAAMFLSRRDEQVNLMDMLRTEDPQFASQLETRQGLIGMTFPENDELEVTDENMEEYVQALTEFKVTKSISEQMDELKRGLYDVLPFGQLEWLNQDEVMQMLGGVRRIDVAELRASTTYKVDGDGVVVNWLWEIVKGMNEKELGDFLNFVSGSRYPPMHGFGETWMSVVVNPMIHLSERITSVEDSVDFMPKSQTCFKQLKLGLYSSKEVLREKLILAVSSVGTLENL